MKRISRDAWLTIALVGVLVLVTIAVAVLQARQQGEENIPSYSSISSAPGGARALWLWLDELGFSVRNDAGSDFQLPDQAGLVLMLEPREPVTDIEWVQLDAWVEDGGTLLLAGERWGTALALQHYEVELVYLEGQESISATVQTPLLASPPPGPIPARVRAFLRTDRHDYVTSMAAGARPVLISLEQGAGRVFLCAAPFPFSNAGLKQAGNPELVLNLVTAAKQRGTIWFDEWHLGLRSAPEEILGPEQWLRSSPAGHAILFAAALVFVFLVLRGRHFGRPVPPPRLTARRAPLEHATAIANLRRRAGHRGAVLDQYHSSLKRDLGKRYRLNPTLPDKEYAAQLAKYNSNIDAEALIRLLARLRQPAVGDAEMVQIAAEAAQWLKEIP